ncbi:MAG: hypothetical protein ACREOO_18400 [bacterium]
MRNIQEIIDTLAQPGDRLPSLADWLMHQVWSQERFAQLTRETYLEEGEKLVHDVEEMILANAFNLYDEIATASKNTLRLSALFSDEAPTTIVVFDGASLREIPMLHHLAKETGFEILQSGYGIAALPSNTLSFVEQRIIGKRVTPSELPRRQELKEISVAAFYYDAVHRYFPLPGEQQKLLLWSQFPDGTFKDMSARFADHFGEIRKMFDTAWQKIVMEIPRSHRIIITSDHGYIFFGQGLESTYPNDAGRWLNQDRFKFFGESENLPQETEGLQVFNDRRLAMLQGRIKNRPQGPSAKHAYRHGGMSLMEMLTPWLVIRRT